GGRRMSGKSVISQETAQAILTLLLRQTTDMNALIAMLQGALGKDEFNEARGILGTVMGETYLQGMYPLFELYPELKPEGLR
ncbi:MAG: hypothetical protein JWL62_2952, partial [Hyphomicrobiales bacterium]|nr:hypothetical protein [Hyphomicrobiales bacterium]